jgi:SAM-dependent methyltransferase
MFLKTELLELIVCPKCVSQFELRNEQWSEGEVESGDLVCIGEGHSYRIEGFVPRFVESDDYADAFALEWNEFRTAHLDSFTGLDRLDKEFQRFLDFPVDALEGKLALDAGCGLGRYAEAALNHGARVVAVDLSRAIDAAYANLKHRDGIYFLQADIFNLPFRPETFDLIYSFGVLHHTPDPPAAFAKLPPLLRPGGRITTMVYSNYNKAYLATTSFYRKLTTRLPKRLLLKLCYVAVPLYYVWRVPVIGPFITRIVIPVSVRPPTHRWRVGNTFDLYSPKYAFTYDHVEVHGWYERAGLTRIRPVNPRSGVMYAATKPPIDDSDWSGAGRASHNQVGVEA